MKVILKSDNELLGDEGQIVEVKDGYARNYLIPNGLAIQATQSNLKNFEEIRKQRRRKIEKQLEESKSLAERIASALVTIKVKSGEEGRIFGSVTAQMIHDELVTAGIEGIDRKKIMIRDAVKSLGQHAIDIKLQHAVVATLNINVVDESADETPVEENVAAETESESSQD